MNTEFSDAVNDALDLFYRQDNTFGRNKATCDVFVNKVTEIFRQHSDNQPLKDTMGLKSVLKICQQQHTDMSKIEKFVPLGT